MRNVFLVEKIQSTETYKELVKKKENVKIGMLESRAEREKITNAFLIYKNTGKVPPHITGVNLRVIKDLIILDEIDSARMPTEESATTERD